MMTLSKLLQTKLYLVAIILISATFGFAVPKPVTMTADVGNGVGEYRFEFHKIDTAKFKNLIVVSAEILVFKKGNSEVLQRLSVDYIDSPYFDVMDVNGDGYQDLLLYDDHGGNGADPSISAEVFMYIPNLQRFVRSKTLSGRGKIEASKNKGCVTIKYKCSAKDYTDEERCFDISTGKWKMANLSTCDFAKSQFIGDWCTNPCFYGSTHRPWNLPCDIRITESEIQWCQGKDKLKRRYEIVYQDSDKETLLVKGGDENEWYSYKSLPTAKHKLTLNKNHSNEYAKPAVELTEESYSASLNKWVGSGAMFITKGECPSYLKKCP